MHQKRVSRILALAALAAIAFYLWWHRGELASIALVSPLHLVLCAFSIVGYLAASGLLSYVMLNKLGARMSILECLSLSVVATGLNAMAPIQGGMVVRAVYLNRFHGFAYSRYLGLLIGSQVLMAIVCSGFAVITLTWMMFVDNRGNFAFMIGGLTLCLLISLLACFLPRLPASKNWFWGRLAAVSDSWYQLRAEPRLLATLVALIGLQAGGQVLSFWTGFGVIGVPVGLLEAATAGAVATLASMISITPGAVGISEAIAAFVGIGLAITPVSSVMASLVGRGVLVVLLLVLMPLAILFLRRRTTALSAEQKEAILNLSDIAHRDSDDSHQFDSIVYPR